MQEQLSPMRRGDRQSKLLRPTLALALVGGLCLALSPLVASAGPDMTFRRADGSTVSGELMRVEADRFVVKVDGREINLMFDQLAPVSVYEGRAAMASPTDPQTHLDLGLYCIEHELLEEAVREFTQAREAAENLLRRGDELLGRARVMAAHSLFRRGQQLEQQGQFVEALARFERVWVQYPDVENLRDELRTAILGLRRALNLPADLPTPVVVAQPGQANPNAANPPVNPANPGANANANPAAGVFDDDSTFSARQKREYDQRRRELETVQRRLDTGTQAMRDGLLLEGTRNAQRKYDEADQELVAAWQLVERLRPQVQDWMPRLRRQVELVAGQIHQNLLRLALTQAHFHARQEDTDQTAKWMGRILALDPDNEDGLKIRMKLTEKALRSR